MTRPYQPNLSPDEQEALRAEVRRLLPRGPGRSYACGVIVSQPHRVGGPGGAAVLGCGFCGTVIAAMQGPGGPTTACQVCATAIRDDLHPLGVLLRGAWCSALSQALSPTPTVTVPASSPPRPCPALADGPNHGKPCLYDEDAETGDGQSDYCVRCHEPR